MGAPQLSADYQVDSWGTTYTHSADRRRSPKPRIQAPCLETVRITIGFEQTKTGKSQGGATTTSLYVSRV